MPKYLNIVLSENCKYFEVTCKNGFDRNWGIMWKTYGNDEFVLDFRGIYCDHSGALDPKTGDMREGYDDYCTINFYMKRSNVRHGLCLLLNDPNDKREGDDYRPKEDGIVLRSTIDDGSIKGLTTAMLDAALGKVEKNPKQSILVDETTGHVSWPSQKNKGERRIKVDSRNFKLEITSATDIDKGDGVRVYASNADEGSLKWLTLDKGFRVLNQRQIVLDESPVDWSSSDYYLRFWTEGKIDIDDQPRGSAGEV